MPFAVQNSHKVISLLAAGVITFAVHGSLLAGFNHLAAQSPAAVFANCNNTTLAPVTLLGRRG